MKESEILKKIKELRNESHCFVKWWRKEDDFLDYDLLERFIANCSGKVEMEGFELLTMEEMWTVLERIAGKRVNLLLDRRGNKVEWLHKGKSGTQSQVCVYTPETLMTIFDVETKGNPVN